MEGKMREEDTMLKFVNVKKQYESFALDLNMEVKPGMVTGLIGANGAGKSTSFKAALGLVSLDGGEITVFGKDSRKLTPQDKEKLGVVLSDAGFCEYLTILDIALILRHMYKKFSEEAFLNRCREFCLPLKQKVKEFSTGMKAKLKLLVAISHEAEFLILDEPTSGLDVVVREELLALLQDYLEEKEERSVLISSHISGDLEKFCDDFYMIHEGKIILHEDTDILLSTYGIIKADEKQYQNIEKLHLLRAKKEEFGYCLLTCNRQFYQENHPELIVEKSGIDDVILIMTKGEQIWQDC